MNLPPAQFITKWAIFLGQWLILPFICFICSFCGILPYLTSNPSPVAPSVTERITGVWTIIAIYVVLLIIYLSPVILPVILAYIFYTKDKKREQNLSDDFTSDKLFFRYGKEINRTILSIPMKDDWTNIEINNFANQIQKTIGEKFRSRFSSENLAISKGTINRILGYRSNVLESFSVKDRDFPQDKKDFVRITLYSKRGSQLTHFIHYTVAGHTLVVHYFSYLRGIYSWYHAADFVIMSPLTIWFWGIAWLQNQYSIIGKISRNIDNSFDTMDLLTLFRVTYFVLMDETRNILREEGLLSEELSQIIFNNIDNSQQINIADSQGTSIGSIVQNVGQGLVKNLAG